MKVSIQVSIDGLQYSAFFKDESTVAEIEESILEAIRSKQIFAPPVAET